MITKTINIAALGMTGDTVPCDILCPEPIGNIPVFDNSGSTVIAYSTYVGTYGWLSNFLLTGSYFIIKKRGNKQVLAEETITDIICSGGTIIGTLCSGGTIVDWENPKENFKTVLSRISGIYGDEFTATETGVCGTYVLVSDLARDFEDMFVAIENAIDFLDLDLRGGPKAKISIPLYISQDIFDIGSYTPVSGISETEENNETYEDSSESGETEYVESQLKTLLREKKSYDNDGNLLPYYEYVSGNTVVRELPYVIGNICNITYSGGCYYYNVLEGVKYYVENEYGELELDEGSEDKTYYDGSMPLEGVIEFTYRVGNSLDEEENNGLGILYTERRRYVVDEDERFINVSEETISNPENADPEVQYAEISEVNKTYEEVAEPAFLVKENHLMGVNDSYIDTDNVHVDRGVSASYEAFNVLGEVNSIDDIEKYRDDWFRIKGKND